MILALLATLGAIVTAFVLYPVFTEATAGAPPAFDAAFEDLRDKKAMLFEAIQDLDFENDSGKISKEDYASARDSYLAQVAAVMAKLDALAPPQKPPETEAKKIDAHACASCGELNPKGSKFCVECGKPLSLTCASCGESIPTKARFCNACGTKVSA